MNVANILLDVKQKSTTLTGILFSFAVSSAIMTK